VDAVVGAEGAAALGHFGRTPAAETPAGCASGQSAGDGPTSRHGAAGAHGSLVIRTAARGDNGWESSWATATATLRRS
jgi:hypothetical protein